MNKIQKIIICSECNKVFETPIILPCNHSICHKHVNKKSIGDKFKCSKCGLDHEISANRFPLNEDLCEIIETQIASSSVHKEAVESVDNLNRMIEDVDNLINDPSSYFYEEISELKNRVNLKSEQLKLKIDEEKDKLLKKLDDYKTRCDSKTPLNLMYKKEYVLFKEWSSSRLFSYKSKFDESKLKQIIKACNESVRELGEEVKQFKSYMSKKFMKYSNHVDFFEQISIDDLFIRNESRKSNLGNNINYKAKTAFNSFGQSISQVAPNSFISGNFYYSNLTSTPKKPRIDF